MRSCHFGSCIRAVISSTLSARCRPGSTTGCRVDRIRDPWPLRGTTPNPNRELPSDDAAAFVADRLMNAAPTYRAVATLHAPIDRVAPHMSDGIGELEAIDADRCRLTVDGDTLAWLAFRLSSVGCEFEVHEPPERSVRPS